MTEKGLGKVYRGKEFLADVQYEIQTERTFKPNNTLTSTGVIPGPLAARMRIDGPEKIDAAFNERLTLHMSDGSKWDFFMSPDGSCTPTGGPHK